MKRQHLILFGGLAVLAFYLYSKKNGMSFASTAALIMGERPQLASQAQFAKGSFAGPQAFDGDLWGGTFNDVPLYQDNNLTKALQ